MMLHTTYRNPDLKKIEKLCNVLSEGYKVTSILSVQESKDGTRETIIKMKRNVFGRLLTISLKKYIDMNICLSYLLVLAPPALCQCSGEMHMTDKSALSKILRSKITSFPPSFVDIDVIDGFYSLYLFGAFLPQTFEKIAQLLLIKICDISTTEIHVIFDRYFCSSIKELTRKDRGEIDVSYTIVARNRLDQITFRKVLKTRNSKKLLFFFHHNFGPINR